MIQADVSFHEVLQGSSNTYVLKYFAERTRCEGNILLVIMWMINELTFLSFAQILLRVR